jgi:NADH-quinone oxidoreductase subunit K
VRNTNPEGYFLLATILLLVGGYGVIVSRNAIRVLMCLEIMMNSANINLVTFSRITGNISGQILVTFSLAIAAAEAAVGFALVLLIFRAYNTTEISVLRKLRF